MSTLLTIGATVLIIWPGNAELHKCQGKLVARAQGLTAIKDVMCESGRAYYDVVGVDERKLVVIEDAGE